MNYYKKHVQRLWFKLKRRGIQYLFSTLKEPKWALMFCFGRIQFFRSLATYIAKNNEYKTDIEETMFNDLNIDIAVNRLKNEGLFVGIDIPKHILSEIIDFSQSVSYFGNGNAQFSFFLPEKDRLESHYQQKFTTAHHLHNSILCPAIQKIEQDPVIWEIAARYLETNPVAIQTRIWWTFATGLPVDKSLSLPFNFHYDVEDYRFIKFMFYLTDVNQLNSPHVCVRGSHKKKQLRHQFSLTRETSKENIMSYYGNDKIVNICGKAGLGFVEDFYCFHRGTVPIAGDRLILEIKFAMNKYDETIKL